MSPLIEYLASGRDPGHATGLADPLTQALSAMLGAAPVGAITINSGFRSPERQAQLYEEALAKYGSEAEARKWVAPPGNSRHNHGLAADLAYRDDAARAWAHENAPRFGLNFRLGHEPWHVELADGHSVGDGHAHGPAPTGGAPSGQPNGTPPFFPQEELPAMPFLPPAGGGATAPAVQTPTIPTLPEMLAAPTSADQRTATLMEELQAALSRPAQRRRA